MLLFILIQCNIFNSDELRKGGVRINKLSGLANKLVFPFAFNIFARVYDTRFGVFKPRQMYMLTQ